jgi:uncharacterized protein (DUF2235 family)
MGKNIIILSDGTGQRGGILFDECRTNIYKLYRATRCGPDSTIKPSDQLTYYDPGIGSEPGGMGFLGRLWRKIHNVVSQATGLGITTNIVDCYAALMRMWEPGDRIFLFGFSRGAYTVRCLSEVLAFCGLPTRGEDGAPLKSDPTTARAVAKIAVKKVYQHVSSPKDTAYLDQRQALGRWFREKFASGKEGGSNAYPYFVGVFDTVASVATPDAVLFVASSIAVIILAAGGALGLLFGHYLYWYDLLIVLVVLGTLAALAYTNIRYAFGLQGYPFWKTVHFADIPLRFYDRKLNPNVGYARHAISIDENRSSFERVAWGRSKDWRNTGPGNPSWFKQLWFSGNHADIGGGYPENESRLSDVALQWMVEEAQSVPDGMKVDPSVLNLYPDALGIQHDECRHGLFKYLSKKPRDPLTEATLFPSVLERLAAEKVLQYDQWKPYRPDVLRAHEGLEAYFLAKGEPAT